MTSAPRTAPLRLAAVTVLGLALVLTACSSDPEPKKTRAVEQPVAERHQPPPRRPRRRPSRAGSPAGWASRTGRSTRSRWTTPGTRTRRSGLSKADVVYVEQVEGGVTRLAAIYSSEYPKFVGPVRSGRITDIDLLRQYGTVGLIYSGSQNKLADNLQRADLKLVSFDQDHTGYTRSPSRPQPYDVIGTFDRLRKRAGKVSTPPKMGYTFGPAPAGGKPAKSADRQLPERAGERRLVGRQEALAGVDGRRPPTGPPRAASSARRRSSRSSSRCKPSAYHDINGANTPQTLTVGQGRALFFRDGQVFEGAWSRAKASDVTSYTIAGQPASFAPGQLWVALIGRDRPVTTTR